MTSAPARTAGRMSSRRASTCLPAGSMVIDHLRFRDGLAGGGGDRDAVSLGLRA